MTIVVRIGKLCMRLVYCILKLFRTKKGKILFLSRQSDTLSLDFRMLKEELEKQAAESGKKIQIVQICNYMVDGKSGIVKFGTDVLRSMYHLATSEVAVLDAYWPAVSMLNHKKSLTVIQMWHAIGKIKQSGYQTLDRESGRSKKVAELMDMHKNYDIIIAGGKAFNRFYCLSFNTTEDKLCNIGLPRIDYLLQTEKRNRDRVLEKYPVFRNKRVVLYAPTFRRNIELKWEPLLERFDFSESVLIIKGHPNQAIECDREGVYMCPEFSSVEMLAACDYLITDYSAIALEGAVLNRKTYYFLYDFEEYTQKNGINVNPFESMPGCAFRDGRELIDHLQSDSYDQSVLDRYREMYLPDSLGTSTRRLGQLVLSKLTGTEN
ncbi:MAG: CDP-glycerol glycerophosphotransferase family protein [Emergencia sp.]